MTTSSSNRTLIVGGGLAGLTCAHTLARAGAEFVLLESTDTVGGRVKTDLVEGFLLDRGFQVFLDAYPEAARVLDYELLDLRPFEPGALVRFEGRFHRFADPWRRPQHLLATALAPVGTLADKLRVSSFRRSVTQGSLKQLLAKPEVPMVERLKQRGFSESMIDRFFRPFLGGVFLDRDLQASSRFGEFVFRMFATGNAVLPAAGMQVIPRQLADSLPDGTVRTNCRVAQIESHSVRLDSGERIEGSQVVVAAESAAADQLLGQTTSSRMQRVTCLYFSADVPPVKDPILVLNADESGPVNNLCVPSQVAPGYARAGKALVSVTVLGTGHGEGLLQEVKEQLVGWYGPPVNEWGHLKSYEISGALPFQPELEPVEKAPLVRDGIFVCGDHCDTASINGAMASGRRAAEAVLATSAS